MTRPLRVGDDQAETGLAARASAAFFQLTDDATGHRGPITSSTPVHLSLYPERFTPLATTTSKVTQSVHHYYTDHAHTYAYMCYL